MDILLPFSRTLAIAGWVGWFISEPIYFIVVVQEQLLNSQSSAAAAGCAMTEVGTLLFLHKKESRFYITMGL